MFSVTVDVIKKIGQIKEMLLGCSTDVAVDDVFSRFSITDFQVKTMLLRQCMQVQEVFDTPVEQVSTSSDSSLSDEDVYKEELGFFLDGKWKDLI